MPDSMKQQLALKTEWIEELIYRYLPEETGYQKTVLSAMNYTMRAGGKRLRPMLMWETYQLFGGSDVSIIAPFMASIEMIHTYSLIHDDLPALDNDDYRRGRKTAHVVYGEDMAILAGDALLNYAFETAASAFSGSEQDITAAKAFHILTRKPGIYGMIGGQTADIEAENRDIDLETLLYIHNNKTAALIECSMMIGAIMAGASDEETAVVEKIANDVGVAFQIQDDILDVTSSNDILGKPVGSDAKNNKQTYVTMMGLERSIEDVKTYTDDAVRLYDSLGRQNDFLRSLLILLTARTY